MNTYSNNIFLDGLDLDRMAYQKKDNLDNKSKLNIFETNVIQKSESFTDDNKRINDLQDEILDLKQKLKTIYEKEEEITRLNIEIKNYEINKKNYELLKKALLQLRSENKILRDKCDQYEIQKIDIDTLKQENKMLKTKLNESESSEDNKVSKDDSDKINIDVINLKNVLNNRLKTYHEKHIDDLILSYELNDKKQIDKKTIEKLLEEAIHI